MTKELTSKGLPIITRECKDDLYKSLGGKRLANGKMAYGDFLEDTKRRLIAENPVLVKFMEEQVGKYPLQFHKPIFEVICGVYALMETQSEIYIQERKSKLS